MFRYFLVLSCVACLSYTFPQNPSVGNHENNYFESLRQELLFHGGCVLNDTSSLLTSCNRNIPLDVTSVEFAFEFEIFLCMGVYDSILRLCDLDNKTNGEVTNTLLASQESVKPSDFCNKLQQGVEYLNTSNAQTEKWVSVLRQNLRDKISCGRACIDTKIGINPLCTYIYNATLIFSHSQAKIIGTSGKKDQKSSIPQDDKPSHVDHAVNISITDPHAEEVGNDNKEKKNNEPKVPVKGGVQVPDTDTGGKPSTNAVSQNNSDKSPLLKPVDTSTTVQSEKLNSLVSTKSEAENNDASSAVVQPNNSSNSQPSKPVDASTTVNNAQLSSSVSTKSGAGKEVGLGTAVLPHSNNSQLSKPVDASTTVNNAQFSSSVNTKSGAGKEVDLDAAVQPNSNSAKPTANQTSSDIAQPGPDGAKLAEKDSTVIQGVSKVTEQIIASILDVPNAADQTNTNDGPYLAVQTIANDDDSYFADQLNPIDDSKPSEEKGANISSDAKPAELEDISFGGGKKSTDSSKTSIPGIKSPDTTKKETVPERTSVPLGSEAGVAETPGPQGSNKFVDAEDSHFFVYFVTMVVLCIIGYLVFHNKQKILALTLEGHSRRNPRRRQQNTTKYRKLDSNLEEAVTSSCKQSTTSVIY